MGSRQFNFQQNKKRSSAESIRKKYHSPKFIEYGDLRDLSKGQWAYTYKEGVYQDFKSTS